MHGSSALPEDAAYAAFVSVISMLHTPDGAIGQISYHPDVMRQKSNHQRYDLFAQCVGKPVYCSDQTLTFRALIYAMCLSGSLGSGESSS